MKINVKFTAKEYEAIQTLVRKYNFLLLDRHKMVKNVEDHYEGNECGFLKTKKLENNSFVVKFFLEEKITEGICRTFCKYSDQVESLVASAKGLVLNLKALGLNLNRDMEATMRNIKAELKELKK